VDILKLTFGDRKLPFTKEDIRSYKNILHVEINGILGKQIKARIS